MGQMRWSIKVRDEMEGGECRLFLRRRCMYGRGLLSQSSRSVLPTLEDLFDGSEFQLGSMDRLLFWELLRNYSANQHADHFQHMRRIVSDSRQCQQNGLTEVPTPSLISLPAMTNKQTS